MTAHTAYRHRARKVFDGISEAPLEDHVITVEDGEITSLRPAQSDDPAPMAEILAPGFIDMQINGAGDAQFNDAPTVETLTRMTAAARKGGTTGLCPTFITAPGTDYLRAMAAVRQAVAEGVPGVLGLHLEGPFLSSRRPGIHDASVIRPLTPEDVAHLTAPFPGALMVTLAPEAQDPRLTAALADAGVLLFAGHSEAQPEDLRRHPGLRGVTHLWNAMSQLTGRAPGLVGAVLDSERLFAGIIADSHHVAPSNLRLAARVMPDRLCLVTDAMLTLGGTRTSFPLHGETIFLEDGRLTNAAGTLAGAHVAMDEAVRNMMTLAGVAPATALRMASGNPARALGLGGELGRIAPGYRADLTLLDADYRAAGVIVGGVRLA